MIDLVAPIAAWYAANAGAEQLATVEPEGETTIPRFPSPERQDSQLPPLRLFPEEQSIANTAHAERLER